MPEFDRDTCDEEVNLNRYRNDDGNLVDVGYGCYIQIYVCPNGDCLCADCAEKALNSEIDWRDIPEAAMSSAECESYIVCEDCGRVLCEEPED